MFPQTFQNKSQISHGRVCWLKESHANLPDKSWRSDTDATESDAWCARDSQFYIFLEQMQKLAAKTWHVGMQYFRSMYQTCLMLHVRSDSLQYSSSLPTFQTSTRHSSIIFCRFKMVTAQSHADVSLRLFFFNKENSLNWYIWCFEEICAFYETMKDQLMLFRGKCAGYVWMGWRIALQRWLNESNSKMVSTVRLQR